MPLVVKASPEVRQLLDDVKAKNHPHLNQALVALEFVESKPFVRDRINLGKVSRFNESTRLLFPQNEKYVFLITLCADVWFGLLKESQREAILDLHLSRFKVAYEPNAVVVNGKKQVVKDEYGRVEYTDVVKTDDEGNPVWKVMPLDITTIAENVKRYSTWYEDLVLLQQAIDSHEVK